MPDVSLPRVAHLLLGLGLSSGLSVALLFARMARTGSGAYMFLNWNLVLAWVPLALALVFAHLASKPKARTAGKIAALLGWFVFFPNAPYLITDLIHLAHQKPREAMPTLYDSVMLFSFAQSGLLLGLFSLKIVQDPIRRAYGGAASLGLVVSTLTASGYGIYLGRFDRYNSWDVVTRPLRLLEGMRGHAAAGLDGGKPVVVTMLFAVVLGVAYVTVSHLSIALRSPSPRRRS